MDKKMNNILTPKQIKKLEVGNKIRYVSHNGILPNAYSENFTIGKIYTVQKVRKNELTVENQSGKVLCKAYEPNPIVNGEYTVFWGSWELVDGSYVVDFKKAGITKFWENIERKK